MPQAADREALTAVPALPKHKTEVRAHYGGQSNRDTRSTSRRCGVVA